MAEKLTDKEIKYSLICCDFPTDELCCKCFFKGEENCTGKLTHATIDLINRQQAEIERLTGILGMNVVVFRSGRGYGKSETMRKIIDMRVTEIRARAIKEFAERLKKKKHSQPMSQAEYLGLTKAKSVVYVGDIDEIYKEMVGEQE